jgi:3-methyl-2-oxobutanoate hydroxymethyltransferase
VKKYFNVAGTLTAATKSYCDDVRKGAFPADEHYYHILEGEEEKFKDR